MRPALAKILAEKTKQSGTKVKLGVTFTDIEQLESSVKVSFTDDTTDEFDLVIGSDGLYSKVRTTMFPEAEKPKYIGQGVWRAVVPRFPEVNNTMMWVGEHLKAGVNPMSKDEMYMFVTQDKKDGSWIEPDLFVDMLKDIMDNGSDKEVFLTPEVLDQYKERGIEPPFIRSVFGRQMRFDVSDKFPLLTTKKVFVRGIIVELIWFLSGSSNIKYLVDNNVHIWDEWAHKRYFKKGVKEEGLPELNQEEFIAKLKELPQDDPFVEKWGDLLCVYGKMWRNWPASERASPGGVTAGRPICT